MGSFILFYIINKKIINALYKLKPNKALKIYMNFYNYRKELYKIFKGYSSRIRYGDPYLIGEPTLPFGFNPLGKIPKG